MAWFYLRSIPRFRTTDLLAVDGDRLVAQGILRGDPAGPASFDRIFHTYNTDFIREKGGVKMPT